MRAGSAAHSPSSQKPPKTSVLVSPEPTTTQRPVAIYSTDAELRVDVVAGHGRGGPERRLPRIGGDKRCDSWTLSRDAWRDEALQRALAREGQ